MNKILKSIGLTMIATLFARFLGFLREILIAYRFGTSELSDAFIVSFSIPELIISGFGAAIATLYIPIYFDIEKRDKGKNNLDIFNFGVFALLMMIAAILSGLFYLFPTQFIKMFASGFDDKTFQLTIKLTKIIILSNFPIMLAYLYKSYAQIYNKFALATFMGCAVNITVIISLFFVREETILMLAYSTLAGNTLYAIMLYIVVKRDKYKQKFTLKFFNADLKKLGIGIIPICFSNLIFEINQIIDRNFASNLVAGTISALNYSSKIINMITAIFGTSIASIVFPRITKIHSEGDEEKEANELMSINQIMLLILMPFMILLIIFSEPIISIFFGHGSFNEDSIRITSSCLIFYSIGVIGFNLKSIWIRAFNARLDTKTPAINSFIAVIVNIILNFSLIGIMQHNGLALATGISSLLTDVLLIIKYSQINTYFKLKSLLFELFKIIIALSAFIPVFFIKAFWIFKSTITGLIILLISSMICMAVYFILLCTSKNLAALSLWNKFKKKYYELIMS